MSIRLRLILSYAAMLIVPLVLFMLAALLLVLVYKGDLQNIRNIYIANNYNASLFTDHEDRGLRRELKRTLEKNPDAFTDVSYLSEIDTELKNSHIGVAVKKNGRFTYISNPVNQPDIMNELPSVQKAGLHDDGYTKRIGGKFYSFEHYEMHYSDKSPGDLYMVGETNPLTNFARRFFPLLFFSLLVILVVTNSVLTYLVSRSIIRPLNRLKKAAEEIKEGNLDFSVESASRDEIGQLSNAFEEMRHQLKVSIERQLRFEENRKELISNISHDLKTPITAIKGYVEGIQDGVADTPDKMDKYVRTIYAKADSMDHMIDELFLYSKLDLKHLPFNFESVDIGAYLQDCIDELSFDLEKKGVRLHTGISAVQGCLVTADREKLKRVILNIINNSVKFMDKAEPEISIDAKETESVVSISVADNGQGIHPEALSSIFDRFYRAELSRNTETGGTGLGLAIAEQIIEGHGGKIWAESALGMGTTVTFTLRKRADKAGEIA